MKLENNVLSINGTDFPDIQSFMDDEQNDFDFFDEQFRNETIAVIMNYTKTQQVEEKSLPTFFILKSWIDFCYIPENERSDLIAGMLMGKMDLEIMMKEIKKMMNFSQSDLSDIKKGLNAGKVLYITPVQEITP